MKKLCALFLLIFAIASVPAFADTIYPGGTGVTYNYNVGNGVTAIATFSLSADGTKMTITITNTSTNLAINPAISGLGFDSTPNLSTGAVTGSTGVMGTWGLASGSGDGLGIGGYEVRAGNQGPCQGANGGTSTDQICAGQTASITFVIVPTIGGQGLVLDATALHIQSTIGSWKPGGTPDNPVPEPATLALLGTGLLGAGKIMRRRGF